MSGLRWRQNMIENPYYSQEAHGPYELHDIGDLDLEEGGTLRDCKLAVATHGKLNAAKDNAILVPEYQVGTRIALSLAALSLPWVATASLQPRSVPQPVTASKSRSKPTRCRTA